MSKVNRGTYVHVRPNPTQRMGYIPPKVVKRKITPVQEDLAYDAEISWWQRLVIWVRGVLGW